jgi:glutathione S-transferase
MAELHQHRGAQGLRPLFNPATPEDYKPLVRASVLKRLTWVNEQLANKSYLMGDQFTVADAYFFTVTGWAQFVGLDISSSRTSRPTANAFWRVPPCRPP